MARKQGRRGSRIGEGEVTKGQGPQGGMARLRMNKMVRASARTQQIIAKVRVGATANGRWMEGKAGNPLEVSKAVIPVPGQEGITHQTNLQAQALFRWLGNQTSPNSSRVFPSDLIEWRRLADVPFAPFHFELCVTLGRRCGNVGNAWLARGQLLCSASSTVGYTFVTVPRTW